MKFEIELYSKLSNKEIESELIKILHNWQNHDSIQSFTVDDMFQEESE